MTEPAIGATIQSWEWTDGRLTIRTEQGTLVGYAMSNCCGDAWFDAVDAEGDLTGATITRVDVSNNEEWEGDDDHRLQDYHERAFGTVYTTKGRLTFELRSSSNGYYSGFCTWRWHASVD